MIGDAEPLGDVCSSTSSFNTEMSGTNIGDSLNSAGLTWGWFTGGFDLTVINPNGTTKTTEIRKPLRARNRLAATSSKSSPL